MDLAEYHNPLGVKSCERSTRSQLKWLSRTPDRTCQQSRSHRRFSDTSKPASLCGSTSALRVCSVFPLKLNLPDCHRKPMWVFSSTFESREPLVNSRLLRASRVCQCQAQSAGNIEHIGKGRNTAMTDARNSRRERRTGFLDFVALLGNIPDIACKVRLAKKPVRRAEYSIIDQRFPKPGTRQQG